MPIAGIVLVKLESGATVEGVLRRMNVGNHAGEGGWRYYGECELEDKNKQRWVIDYLDVESVANVWNSRSQEYERLGLIKISK
jgi:hypothetical protein